jgi:hypothetical protein
MQGIEYDKHVCFSLTGRGARQYAEKQAKWLFIFCDREAAIVN